MDEEIKIGSNRSFGIVFSIFFVLVNTYFYYKDGSFSLIIFLISFVFLILGLINSKILTPLNFLWFKFGILLSKIISPIIMSFIFFIVVTPLAILTKIFKKYFLNLDKKKNLKKNSYWIDKEKYKNSMKDQF